MLTIRNHKVEGQGLIEYALIIILISIVVIIVMGLVGGQINQMFEGVINGIGT